LFASSDSVTSPPLSTRADRKYVPALRLSGSLIVVTTDELVLAARPVRSREPTGAPAPGAASPCAI